MEEREERGDVLLFPYYRGRLLPLLPPLLLYQKGRLQLSYRHVFPCVSSSLAHIASQPPFVILFPRGDPSEMPGALGGWSDLPFVLCFVFSLLLLLSFVVLVCLSCYRQVRLRSGARYFFPDRYPNQSKSVVENEEEGRILFVPLQEKRKRKKHPRAKYKKRVETPLLFSLKISLCVF